MDLRITEIFLSLQGETRTVGLPTVFIRLTGCPLRCGYCDTAYAFKGGKKMSLDDIIAEVKKYKAHYITVTGGEPLAQKNVLPLMSKLCDEGYEVSVETSGALDVSEVDSRVVKVVDLKTPGSKECSKNLYENIEHLNKKDQVKFVICNREDYDWSVATMSQYALPNKCEVLFSPSYNDISGTTLADWIVQDQLPVRFQMQLHKILWQDQPGK
ncbi:MAG: 7-carboxy-7-deazaguanine synthase [Gammaproteobacteria bacterium]|jgi:7-carboxy-7-deazaguanine synthase|nr:7-carboxy-7-deazaguanine synthase [Gammaproteobacteria bacterium]